MSAIRLVDGSLHEPPAGFDAVAYVSASLARVPWTWEVEVHLAHPLEVIRSRMPATLAELSESDGGTLLQMRVSSLDWMASLLAGLDCDFMVVKPDELRATVRALAGRLQARVASTRG
jgi:predicted DNA-binding transcriptional regulator YafY